MNQRFPPPFEDQMRQLLGSEYEAFAAAMSDKPPVSIRRNPLKLPAAHEMDGLPGPIHPVPWHPDGRYLTERPVFTLDPLFHAGAYYVQEASSMFLYEALRQTVDFSKPLQVLDLCAAPGGKSTLLVSMMGPQSLLVANEVIRQRVAILRENLEKWGAPNVAVCSAETEVFGVLENWFDAVVADAPCSGEGLFRKDPDAVREWSPAHVEHCALRQRRILAGAVAALRPGGVLAYSTCTYNHREDEENAAWLAAEFNLEPLQLKTPAHWGIAQSGNNCRFFPHRLEGEGFFISLFRKKEAPHTRPAMPPGFRSIQALAKKRVAALQAWIRPDAGLHFYQTPTGEVLALPARLESAFLILDNALKNKWFGTNIGQFKGDDFVPAHALALSTLVAPALPAVDFSREQALLYLKKEVFDLPSSTGVKGWALARYRGLNLGWLKILPNRWNNYLPNERRIRMDLPI